MADKKNPPEEIELKVVNDELLDEDSKIEDLKVLKTSDEFPDEASSDEIAPEKKPFIEKPEEIVPEELLANLSENDAIELQYLNPPTNTVTVDDAVDDTEVQRRNIAKNLQRLQRYLTSTRPEKFKKIGIFGLVVMALITFAVIIIKCLITVPYDQVSNHFLFS